MKIFLKCLADILLPRTCLVCGTVLQRSEEHICLHCLADIPLTYFWHSAHNAMADKFNECIQRYLCNHPGAPSESYCRAASLFFFSNDADFRHIPYSLKYQSDIAAGKFFGKMLGSRLAKSGLFSDADLVIPVPLHWTRQWKRGYNQAEVVASAVAECMGAVLCTDLLKRVRRTQTQTKVEVGQKGTNVMGAFAIRRNALQSSGNLRYIRHILIVDDVFTTGSTLFACFAALRTVFPPSVRISIATLGYVGH